MPEFAGHFIDLQPEEIFYLGAGDQDCDAVGESDHDGTRNELDGRAHAGEAQNDQHHAGHHGAHEQAIDAVHGDDARDHDDEGAGGPADLGLRTAQSGDQKSRDDRAIDAGLRGEPEAMENAIASGRATRPTVMPARDRAGIC